MTSASYRTRLLARALSRCRQRYCVTGLDLSTGLPVRREFGRFTTLQEAGRDAEIVRMACRHVVGVHVEAVDTHSAKPS